MCLSSSSMSTQVEAHQRLSSAVRRCWCSLLLQPCSKENRIKKKIETIQCMQTLMYTHAHTHGCVLCDDVCMCVRSTYPTCTPNRIESIVYTQPFHPTDCSRFPIHTYATQYTLARTQRYQPLETNSHSNYFSRRPFYPSALLMFSSSTTACDDWKAHTQREQEWERESKNHSVSIHVYEYGLRVCASLYVYVINCRVIFNREIKARNLKKL